MVGAINFFYMYIVLAVRTGVRPTRRALAVFLELPNAASSKANTRQEG